VKSCLRKLHVSEITASASSLSPTPIFACAPIRHNHDAGRQIRPLGLSSSKPKASRQRVPLVKTPKAAVLSSQNGNIAPKTHSGCQSSRRWSCFSNQRYNPSKLIRWFLTHDIGLTNTAPSKTGDTIAGTTHNYPIKTAYYKAEIPIWLDEVTDPKAWSSEFLKPEAREVLTVIGAFIVCFRWPIDEAGLKAVKFLLENVREVVKEGCGYGWDGVCLAVAMPQSTTPYLEKSFEEWEGICQDSGFEFIDFVKKGRNEFSGKSVHDF
jgi:hypothetical protein